MKVQKIKPEEVQADLIMLKGFEKFLKEQFEKLYEKCPHLWVKNPKFEQKTMVGLKKSDQAIPQICKYCEMPKPQAKQ